MSLLDETDFENCTKCTICTGYCPVSAANINYPGPKQAGPDGERLRLKDAAMYDVALTYCTNCKRCEVVCPSGVKIGDIIQLAKQKYDTKKPPLRDAMLSHTDLMGSLATPFAPLVNASLQLTPVKKALDAVFHIPHQRKFPRYAFGTFRQWFRKHAQKDQQQFSKQVAFFHGCYINYNNPSLGKDVVKILNAVQIGVQLLKKEKCCGVAMIMNKFFTSARKNAMVNVASLSDMIVDKKIPVLLASSTCTLTLRDEYPHILGIDTSQLRSHINLVTRFLYQIIEDNPSVPLKPLAMRVAYHTPCHMEKLGWTSYTLSLLRRIPGLELTILESQCCGIAGTYGFKKENYATAQEIAAPMVHDIETGNFDLVITDCETCKWQIEMSTSKRCEHPLTLFAMAIDDQAN